LDAFVASFTATFGGQGSKKVVANILPEPSNTTFQYVWTQWAHYQYLPSQRPSHFRLDQNAQAIWLPI
jgi:hypothetical protein